MILGWFKGPRLEIMKWLRTDKETEFQFVDSTPFTYSTSPRSFSTDVAGQSSTCKRARFPAIDVDVDVVGLLVSTILASGRTAFRTYIYLRTYNVCITLVSLYPMHYRLRCSIGFLNVQKSPKEKLFLTQGIPKSDNFALFVKIMTQILYPKNT